MGSFAEETRRRISVHPRGAGRLRHRSPDAAPSRRSRAAPSTARSSPSRSPAARGPMTVDTDEQPAKGDASQDPDAEARLRQGRHDHRRQRLVDLRRRRGAGADPPERRRPARPQAGRADRRHAAHAHEPAQVHHRPGRRDAEGARQGRLEGRRRRPVRGQRGLRLRRHDRDARPRHPARQDQRPRRRDRARPPDRRQRRADPRDPAQRARNARRQKRGVASLCIGGGEATAMAVELVD